MNRIVLQLNAIIYISAISDCEKALRDHTPLLCSRQCATLFWKQMSLLAVPQSVLA